MVRLMNDGNLVDARKIALKHNRLFNDLFIESNPVPVKAALAAMYPDIFTTDVRLPLCRLSELSRAQLMTTMQQIRLI